MPLRPPPLSLYVHLPWCVRKCPYCDFNSHEIRGEVPFARYIDALLADLECDLPLVWGRPVHSVFFGGGTPSLFPAAELGRFLNAARARLTFAPNLEITLETNPGTVEHGKFEEYRAIGINRLSFGIQSFDDGCLKRLGRIHNGREAETAIILARKAGFDNINLDLMYSKLEKDQREDSLIANLIRSANLGGKTQIMSISAPNRHKLRKVQNFSNIASAWSIG